MPSDRWQQVVALFETAVSLPPDARAAYLEQASSGDPALRREVEALLAAEGQGKGFLTRAVERAVRAAADAGLAGRRVGPYEITREVGRGGMGAVYLAVRADDAYRKTVAIKVLRGGADDAELRRRFLAERQILASLEHPNIARLLDGGATADGLPYVVMEYVEGERLDVFCERRALPLDARLRLFVKVCDAVQYAHRSLVVHRDLKPGNILVTAAGEPKLLDFGIAKLLDAPAGEPRTRTAVRLMTPEYASPEQMRGQAVTTATDVHALGVVLYELLAGRRPYAADSLDALERAICDAQPERPSVAARAGVTAAWARALAGDLDTITLMALRKEPELRYASVEHLADDLRRHLEGRPVLARPDSVRYRAAKFVRRHRVGVAVTATTVAVVAALTVFYTVRLAAERDRARLESDKASQVSAFLTRLFAVSNPEQSRGEEITARALLDSGRTRIATELAAQPEVQATLLQTMGEAYWKLGMYDTATAVIREALRIREGRFGRSHPEVAQSLTVLGSLLYERGFRDSAAALFEEALAIRRRTLPPQDTATALALNDLGWVTYERGNAARADSLHREALAMRRALRGPEHADVAESMNNLGAVAFETARYAQAESLFAAAYDMRRRLLGERHPLVAASLLNLATAAEYGGRLEEAERRHLEALALARATRGHDHPDNATNLVNLGRVLRRRGRYGEAEPYLREAVALDRRGRGPDHPFVAYDLRALAALLSAKGDTAGARRALDEAIAIYRRSDPSPGGGIAQALGDLGAVLVPSDPVGAERRLREALSLLTQVQAADHPAVLDIRIALGAALSGQRRYAAAESLLVEAERAIGAHPEWGPQRRDTVRARLRQLYERWGQPATAAQYR